MEQMVDLWGELHEQQPPRRRRKGDIVLVGQLVLKQERLFSSAELQVPFPDAPISTLHDTPGEVVAPGTLFAPAEVPPAAGQRPLFAPPQEAAQKTSQDTVS